MDIIINSKQLSEVSLLGPSVWVTKDWYVLDKITDRHQKFP